MLSVEEMLIGKIIDLNSYNSTTHKHYMLGTMNDITYFILHNILNPYYKYSEVIYDEIKDEQKDIIHNMHRDDYIIKLIPVLLLITFIIVFLQVYS